MTEDALRIVPLDQAPSAIAPLAGLLRETWPEWYLRGKGDAVADLEARASHGMPHGWAAFLGADPVGTIGLSETSYGAAGEGPWLVGLCVSASVRGSGIGTALVCEVMSAAAGPLYTTVREARGLFLRLGWQDVRDVEEGWRVLTWSE